jgi:hypothetical protein
MYSVTSTKKTQSCLDGQAQPQQQQQQQQQQPPQHQFQLRHVRPVNNDNDTQPASSDHKTIFGCQVVGNLGNMKSSATRLSLGDDKKSTSIPILSGNLLDQKGYLFQQCNCVTKKALGLSKAMIDRFGASADAYSKRNCADTPGTFALVPVNDTTCVVHLFAQYAPGKPGGRWYNFYCRKGGVSIKDDAKQRRAYFAHALELALKNIDGRPCFFPWRIGCGLAGGSWPHYIKMIRHFAVQYHGDVYVVRLQS